MKSYTIKNNNTIKELIKLRTVLGINSFIEIINFLIKFFKDNNKNKGEEKK